MKFYNNHNQLFLTAFALFSVLTIVIAIIPAIKNGQNNAPLPDAVPLTESELAGKLVYINNGCVACHTQQVRNIDMDKVFGERPSIPADYASIVRTDFWRNTATLMGTERTGPDLTAVGSRQPSLAWNLLHLYQPRAVVEQSIMPAYPWLFTTKEKIEDGDVEVTVPNNFRAGIKGHIVATKEALNLVEYLQSLKQTPLPTGKQTLPFLYEKVEITEMNEEGGNKLPDGHKAYIKNCQSCHQADGKGLKGAFPPLKGSPIVLGNDLELFVNIIMLGYDARPEYASMNAVGIDNNLSAEEITAIINHEKTSWGNNAKTVTVEEVNKIVEFIKITAQK